MRNPVRYLWEMFSEWADISPWLPWFVKHKVYCVNDYLRWRKEPRGVKSQIQDVKQSFILKRCHDVWLDDDFDTEVEEVYEEYASEREVLMTLKRNIRLENGLPPKLSTVEEYCQEFGFELYERKY